MTTTSCYTCKAPTAQTPGNELHLLDLVEIAPDGTEIVTDGEMVYECPDCQSENIAAAFAACA